MMSKSLRVLSSGSQETLRKCTLAGQPLSYTIPLGNLVRFVAAYLAAAERKFFQS